MALTHLSRGRWSHLQTPVLGNNRLSSEAFESLCHADWLHQILESLDLSQCSLGGANIRGLRNWLWPKFSSLQLPHNDLDNVSMTYLVKTDWPDLKLMDLHNNRLDDAAIKVLATNSWQMLEHLIMDLRLNKKMTHPVLNNKQQLAALF